MKSVIADPDQLIRLLYFSRANEEVQRCPSPYMRDILSAAVPKNAEAGLTGALLYCDGWFVQALEGARTTVGAVFGLIGADRRHGAVTQISASLIVQREFKVWSMCGATLSPSDDAIVKVLENNQGFHPDKQTPMSLFKLLKTVVAIKDRDGALLI